MKFWFLKKLFILISEDYLGILNSWRCVTHFLIRLHWVQNKFTISEWNYSDHCGARVCRLENRSNSFFWVMETWDGRKCHKTKTFCILLSYFVHPICTEWKAFQSVVYFCMVLISIFQSFCILKNSIIGFASFDRHFFPSLIYHVLSEYVLEVSQI